MRRVAFILLHPHTCDDFISDMPSSLCSGQLQQRGHFCQVLQLYLDRDDAARSRTLQRRLIEHLGEGRFDTVVLDQCWSASLPGRIKQRTGATIIGTDLYARPTPAVDLVMEHFGNNPLALVRLVEALDRGGELAQVPNVWLRRHGALVPGEAPPEPRWQGPPPPFTPDLEHLLLNENFTPPVQRKTLMPNCGCPHALDARENPFFQGLELEREEISTRGCSFCHQGGDYQGQTGQATSELLLDQLQTILTRLPQVREYILRDQSCLRYLPRLLRGATRRQLPPLCFLVSARADFVRRFEAQLEQALELARDAGHSIELYLIGFENLSDRVLQIYNKGMTVADCAEAVRIVRGLHRRFPRSFPARYRTSSFILFFPWVTPDDLQLNIDKIHELGITDFSADLVRSKLRLYPNLPLYHRAHADGLLLQAHGAAHEDNAALAGYSQEHPWRFADPRAELVYALVCGFIDRVPQDRQIWLLQQAVDLVRRSRELDHATAARALEAQLELPQASDPARPADPAIRVEDHEQRSPDTINITTACNQRCIFCAGFGLAPISEEEILARLEGLEEVVLQGGEPTLSSSLFRYARHARAHGAQRVTLVTNGLRLAYRRFAQGCLDAGIDSFMFALPSHDEQVNDRLSQLPGSFALKLRALDQLTALGAAPQVRLIHLLTRLNFEGLPDYVRFLGRRLPQIRALEIKLMQCLGRVEHNWELIPSLTELRPHLEQALQLCQEQGIEVVVNGVPPCILPDHVPRLMSFHMRQITGRRLTGRRKLEICQGCPLDHSCLGVRTDYLKIFGPGEVVAARRALQTPDKISAVPVPPPRCPLTAAAPYGPERERQQALALAINQGRMAEALAQLRALLGIGGCEASPDQLRRPAEPPPMVQALTMRGFKPAELAMLRHDLKPVVKLEDIPRDEARLFVEQHRQGHTLVCSEPYQRDDLRVDQQQQPAGELVTIYASRGDGANRLAALDRAGQRHSARQAGQLLGYPDCCVEHFVRASARGHEAGAGINEAVLRSAWAGTPRRDRALPFQNNILSDHGLLSFYPCQLRCEQALAWADRVLEALLQDDPQQARRCRRRCARPVLFFRLPFFVVFAGQTEGHSLFYDSFAVNTQGSALTRRLQRLFCRDLGRLLADGDRLTVTDQTLVISRGDRLVARLTKAHPTACMLLGFSESR